MLWRPALSGLSSLLWPGGLRRRAAFDIGSGASKLLVADYDPASGKIVRIVFETERPLAFKADAQSTASGTLSASIRSEGLALLSMLAAKAKELGAIEASGVATEVFRTAPNGLQFLRELESRTGVRVTTLSQEREAHLGLATAEALGTRGKPAWDSGGGSFQITARDPDARANASALLMFTGKLGTGPSFERLITTVQGKLYSADPAVSKPNPVERQQADALVAALQAELPPAPEWLRGASVNAIGGWNCIFATTLRALTVLARKPDGSRFAPEICSFTPADARRALDAVAGRGDDELLEVAGTHEEAEGPWFVVPKIALLVAVASHLGLNEIRYCKATGLCAGVVVAGDFTSLLAHE